MPETQKTWTKVVVRVTLDEILSKMTRFNFPSTNVSLTIRCCEKYWVRHVICAIKFESYPHKVTHQYHRTDYHQRIPSILCVLCAPYPGFFFETKLERERNEENQSVAYDCVLYLLSHRLVPFAYTEHQKAVCDFRCVYVFQLWDVRFVKSSLRFVMYLNVVTGRLHIIWRHIIWYSGCVCVGLSLFNILFLCVRCS